jgi:hypothetical protein
MFISEWRKYPSAPYLVGSDILSARVLTLLKLPMLHDKFFSPSATGKYLRLVTERNPSFQRQYQFRPKTSEIMTGYGFTNKSFGLVTHNRRGISVGLIGVV